LDTGRVRFLFRLLVTLLTATSLVAAASPPSDKLPPTFYQDILPILQDHCQSRHRPSQIAPMPLVTYEQTRPWAAAIAKTVQDKTMPPWFADPRFGHFSNDPLLTGQQIATVTAWADAGAPAGDARGAPPPRQTRNTPTKSCPHTFVKINGYRWVRCVPPARSTCITRWFRFVRRIPPGCGTRRAPPRSPGPPRRPWNHQRLAAGVRTR
jgi:hypothetical protein